MHSEQCSERELNKIFFQLQTAKRENSILDIKIERAISFPNSIYASNSILKKSFFIAL